MFAAQIGSERDLKVKFLGWGGVGWGGVGWMGDTIAANKGSHIE